MLVVTPLLALSLLAAPAQIDDQTTVPSAAMELDIPARTAFSTIEGEHFRRHKDGSVSGWSSPVAWFGKLNQAGELFVDLSLLADAPTNRLRLQINATVGDWGHSYLLSCPAGAKSVRFGPFDIPESGFHRLILAVDGDGERPGLKSLRLSGPAAEAAHFTLVERRNAASVHLGYPVPDYAKDDVEWFFCEVTPRTEPLWTYYEATGWHRGYFGMQVNSPTERRIIFSVWDSGNEAVSRDKVAAEDRVQLLAKGEDVYAGGFGNEGTGGHSHLVYDWELGDTFQFLLQAKAEGSFTTYTGWFYFPEKKAWGLIASFKAPFDGKLPRGLYSFNENFSGANGHLQRICEFHNQWIRTSSGEWIELKEARFTHDGTGKENRLDRSAGVNGDRFYLANGGFVEDENPTAVFTAYDLLKRAASKSGHPLDKDLPSVD
jgi:hypothetical protein